MAIQLSVAVRNARGDALETTIGTAPVLEVRTGAPPENCAAADAGTLIASVSLPSDWLTAADNGVKSLNGTWPTVTASGTGEIGHFRVKQDTTCHMQGTAGEAGDDPTPDMILDNKDVNAGQDFTITQFTLTEPNA